ncbi:hypothetical protein [Enterococcus sp. CWB-B31]|uniref:hypothetical protein n=1 Tax=Enterococcus sp. CWB-B31 TaxID=2885159 RepID=UPI001E55103F|nr:hypothetical protein [Enterococcus sp. CWB-B31]MCB5954331.1 hypothetical protein [Enterococcus sp. CWB-B31]
MSDILKETNSCRGGTYKYFENIDDMLIAFINRESQKLDGNYGQTIKIILAFNEVFERKIENFLNFLRERVLAMLNVYGKIYLDGAIILANQNREAI